MIRFRVGVTALVGLLATGALVAPPASAAQGSWSVADSIVASEGSEYVDVARGATNAWAIASADYDGAQGIRRRMIVKHWYSGRWHVMATPKAPATARYPSLTDIDAVSPTDVWVTGYGMYPDGNQGAFFSHWDGHAWYAHNFGTQRSLTHVSTFSDGNVWLLGEKNAISAHPVASYIHWDGHRFWQGSLPALPGGSSDRYWMPAVSNDRRPALLHYDGHRFTIAAPPSVSLPSGARGFFFADALRRGANDVFVTVAFDAGEGIGPGLDLYHWDGRTWRLVLRRSSDSPAGITTDGAGGLWLGSAGLRVQQNLLHVVNGRVVANVAVPASRTTTFEAGALTLQPGTRRVWAAGELVRNGRAQGQIRTYDPAG